MRIADCGLRNVENCSSIRNQKSEIRNFIRNGFTLVELVLVCVVVGILLAATVPRFQHTADRLRTERSAFELTQLLRYARERALVEGQETAWVWHRTDRVVSIERVATSDPSGVTGASQGPEQSQPDAVRFTQSSPLPQGVEIDVARDGQAVECSCVRFFPDGQSEPTMLTIRSSQQTYTISVQAATGQVVLTAGVPPR